ncbi:hypothetical protein [Methylomagnum ishizawai]|uniref:hypothetical protein n=1 Tax=Methylomagnum ishizawai TaxID=1760988 RepID=UPI001C335042|nr:hypothetical protein [Methylomagnum ishizawai]BBL74900.1 hypothetical protein MishRS11D_19980 [Methylomagnum ishizawai]
MADPKSAQEALLDRIVSGTAGLQAAEASIYAALKTFMDTTANEVATLVQNNNPQYPQLREEMLKLEKGVLALTLEAIQAIHDSVPVASKPGKSEKP